MSSLTKDLNDVQSLRQQILHTISPLNATYQLSHNAELLELISKQAELSKNTVSDDNREGSPWEC